MGSPVSPVIANIYMEYFESLAILSSPTLIKWWFRYVDDVHSATRKGHVNNLQEHLNSIDLHIKFTIELTGTYGLSFLDTLTKPTPTSIESTVYKKPTHTDRYLYYISNHHISAKLSVIHTIIHRAKQVCPTPEFLAKEMDHLHKVLQNNHFQTQFFQQGKPQQKTNKKPNPPTGMFIEGARVVIPYIKGFSEQYRHTIAKYRVRVFFKCTSTNQVFTHASKRSNSRCTENWYNLPLEMPSQQLHSYIHRWNQQVPEWKFLTIDIKPPVRSETTTSPQTP